MRWIKTPVDLMLRVSAETWSRPVCGPALLHIAATAYCAERETGGVIPLDDLPRLLPWDPDGPNPRDIAMKLCAVGRWQLAETSTDFCLMDFELQSPPEALSSARSEAGRRGGLRSGLVRRKQNEAIASFASSNEANPSKRSDGRGEEDKNMHLHIAFASKQTEPGAVDADPGDALRAAGAGAERDSSPEKSGPEKNGKRPKLVDADDERVTNLLRLGIDLLPARRFAATTTLRRIAEIIESGVEEKLSEAALRRWTVGALQRDIKKAEAETSDT